MAPYERNSMPQVAQFLAIDQDPLFPLDELTEYLRRDLQERFASQLPAALLGSAASVR